MKPKASGRIGDRETAFALDLLSLCIPMLIFDLFVRLLCPRKQFSESSNLASQLLLPNVSVLSKFPVP
jgi:hypothetical protein